MGSGVMTYIPNFIKIGLIVKKLMGEGKFTDTQRGDLKSLLFFKSLFFSLLSLFKKIIVGLGDLHEVCVSVSPPPTIYFWMPEPVFMKLGTYIMAPEPISTAYFVNPSR
jgi:hypothetical protein